MKKKRRTSENKQEEQEQQHNLEDIKFPKKSEPKAPDKKPGVTINFGIHTGNFNAHGMTVEQARNKFGGLMNIDPAAVPVVNGKIVDSDYVIGNDIDLLSFVKESSAKGTEVSKLEDDKHYILLDHENCTVNYGGIKRQYSISDFIASNRNSQPSKINEFPFPPHVKWHVSSKGNEVFVLEMEPELRSIKIAEDIDKDEENYDYKIRTLATPYVVAIVHLTHKWGYPRFTLCELFYRKEKLTSLDDVLCRTNLPNVCGSAEDVGRTCMYIEDQVAEYMEKNGDSHPSVSELLNMTMISIWGSPFNTSYGVDASSEYARRSTTLDKRVRTVTDWEKASIKDPDFIKEIDWEPARRWNKNEDLTVRYKLEAFTQYQGPNTFSKLAKSIKKKK